MKTRGCGLLAALLVVAVAGCGQGTGAGADGDVGRDAVDPGQDAVQEIAQDLAGDAVPDGVLDVAADADRDPGPVDDPGMDVGGEVPLPKPGFVISIAESGAAGAGGFGYLYVANPPTDDMGQVTTAHVGDCRFVEPEVQGVCEPFCAWPSFCRSDNTCHAEASPVRWAGDIAVSGLKVPCSLPIQAGGGYPYYQGICDPVDPPDLFDAGALLTATAAGGDDLPGFTMQTLGVVSIETTLPCSTFALVAGQPVNVTWTPGNQEGDRIRFLLISANHGSQFGHVECDTADTGSLTVDASLVDLHRAAMNPVPSWRMVRMHQADAFVDGTTVVLEARGELNCMYGH